MIVVMVHRAAIQLDPAPANVLISYIIGVGGLLFTLPFPNAKMILIETNTALLAQSYLGKVIQVKYTERQCIIQKPISVS